MYILQNKFTKIYKRGKRKSRTKILKCEKKKKLYFDMDIENVLVHLPKDDFLSIGMS